MSMTPYNTDLTRALKWMHNNAPKLQSIIQQKADWYSKYNTAFWTNWEANVFDIRTANAFGLVVWCIILGIPLDLFDFSPITNAFAYGAQRGNYLDGGGNVAPIEFVTTPVLYGNGAVIPASNYTLNETTDAVTFTAPPVVGTVLSWTATVENTNTNQQLIVQQPRKFGTGDGTTTVFNLTPSDGANYNEVGNNFYGGGSNVVGLLSEIRYACQLRYVALVSNGRQQWINQMLQYIFNQGNPWNFPEKQYFYLTDNTLVPQDVAAATIWRDDWQGNQLMYATARTNYAGQSNYGSFWSDAAGSGITFTAGIADPAGGTNAVRCDFSTITGTDAGPVRIKMNSGGTNIPAGTFVGSFWARVESGTAGTLQSDISDQSPEFNWTPTGTWQRFTGVGYSNPTTGAVFFDVINSGVLKTSDLVIDLFGVQIENGTTVTSLITNATGTPLTVTDYTLDTSSGEVTFATAPVTGAALTWEGTWQWATTPAPQAFGTGDGSTTVFTLTPPPGAVPPVTQTSYMEYRIGANMNLSSQFLTIMNTPAYGIMPQCAGIKYAVVQES